MRVCSVIFLCQILLLFSIVSMIYLCLAVYLPSFRSLTSGVDNSTDVICETIRREHYTYANNVPGLCSCTAGCLRRKEGLGCYQIEVKVRNKGRSLLFQDCHNSTVSTCNSEMNKNTFIVEEEDLREFTGIINTPNLFRNTYNVTQLVSCNPIDKKNSPEIINCTTNNYKCNYRDGLYFCEQGICYKYQNPNQECKLLCPKHIETTDKNVLLFKDNEVDSVKCGSVRDSDMDEVIWTDNNSREMLLTTCSSTAFNNITNSLQADDCLNTGVLDRLMFENTNKSDYNYLYSLFQDMLKTREKVWGTDPVIAERTMLYINLEGCIPDIYTLDCYEYERKFGGTGSPFSTPSRHPCYYSPKYNVAVIQIDQKKAHHDFLIAVLIPLGVLFSSSLSLVLFYTTNICKKQKSLENDRGITTD